MWLKKRVLGVTPSVCSKTHYHITVEKARAQARWRGQFYLKRQGESLWVHDGDAVDGVLAITTFPAI